MSGPSLKTPAEMRAWRPAQASITNAVEQLHQRLLRDEQRFRIEGDGGHAGSFKALLDTIAFLRAIGAPNPLLFPIMAIADAMAEAEKGVIAPVLGYRPRAGGAPATSMIGEGSEGMIAAVAEGFFLARGEHGWGLKEAMIQAAMALQRNPAFAGLTATRVKNIRDKVRQEIGSVRHEHFKATVDHPGFRAAPLATARRLAADATLTSPATGKSI